MIDSRDNSTHTSDGHGPVISRRAALRLLLGAGAALATAGTAMPAFGVDRTDLDDAEAALSDAQDRLDEVEAQLDALAAEYEEMSATHAKTLQDIEAKQAEIDATQAEIDALQAQITQLEEDIAAKEAELDEDQRVLSDRISSAYKSGEADFLSILFASASFEELTSNIYYLGKINEADRALIEKVKKEKAALEQTKADLEVAKAQVEEQMEVLEGQMAELAALSAQQQSELDALQAKQEEVEAIISSLDAEVQELMEKRDQELLAYQQAQAAERSYAGPASMVITGSGSLSDVVAAAYSTPSPGAGWCAAWVTDVFINAGVGHIGGNACDMYSSWCWSSDRGSLQPGMIVACSSHPHTYAGRIYGHVGVYVGGGTVRDNIGYIRTIGIDEWISFYGATVPVRWGWLGGIALS